MAYKLGDRTLFEQNSVHAAFYREYLKEEFRMERYEWESCGDTSTRKFQKGKTVCIFPLSDQYFAVLSNVCNVCQRKPRYPGAGAEVSQILRKTGVFVSGAFADGGEV